MSEKSGSPAPPAAGWRRNLRARPRRLAAAGLGLAAVAGLVWPVVSGESGQGGGGAAPGAAAPGGPSALRVEVARPAPGGVRRLTIQPGSVHAFESVDLYAKASGFLKAQAVDIGSPIRRGQVLAEIDAPELRSDVEEAAAAVERARAQVEQAVSRVATAEAQRAAADAAVSQATADIGRLAARRALGEKQYARVADLNARDAVDRKLVDEQQSALEEARAAEATAHAAVRTAHAEAAAAAAKVVQARADAAEARAAVRVAEARLAHARVLAGYTRITAPFDGVVTRRTFHPGAFIRSAADGAPEPLLTVARTDLMRVVVRVPDLDVPLLDPGDAVTFEVDALKGREYAGTVARLGRSEDPATRTMRAEVDLPNTDGTLVEGMYGRATIALQPPSQNLTIPAACVVGHAGRGSAAVYIVREGRARRLPVTLGGDDGAAVEVLAGLTPADAVVVRPPGTLDDGAAVLAASAR